MPIRVIHVSDIHFGSGESHGRLNPASGLNIRFEDFVGALQRVVDYTISSSADVFLFSGDAYRNASPEPTYQKAFAVQLKRLSDAGVRTILLVGNHDQLLKSTASHSMSVFQSLAVPGVLIVDRPMRKRIDTAHGAFQLIGIPHVSRHQLMTNEKYTGVGAGAVDRVLCEHVETMLRSFYEELDPDLPTIVTAHMTVDRAVAGIEEELLVGYTLTFPTDIFIDPRIDYVALGHVHRFQAIQETNPAIVYAGSLERVDFGEEGEDKGFVEIELERSNTHWRFISVEPRPFLTLKADLANCDDPTNELTKLVSRQVIPGCVLRVRFKVNHDQLPLIDEDRIRQAAAAALSVRLQPEVCPSLKRARLPQLTDSTVSSPLVALATYLDEVAPQRKEQLLARTRDLIARLESELP